MIKMKKQLLVVAVIVAISLPLVAYAGIEIGKIAGPSMNPEASSEVVRFEVIVNGKTSLEIFVYVDLSDGLTEREAELIAGITFTHVKGEFVWRQLEALTFDDTRIDANYAWGNDETDLGHVYHMTADLISQQISVNHCF
ncbi:MAG: hypothetical protein JSV58_06255 [Candidatus Bathyarchaeota archaeon]|nr:MAG: hypothetical protein JSV58_06255 [Candidatus Bathyarchaeota archaeon]